MDESYIGYELIKTFGRYTGVVIYTAQRDDGDFLPPDVLDDVIVAVEDSGGDPAMLIEAREALRFVQQHQETEEAVPLEVAT